MSRECGFREAPDAAVQRVCPSARNAAVLHDYEQSQVRGNARDTNVVVQRQFRIAIERGAEISRHVEGSDCRRPGQQQIASTREHEAEHHSLRGNHGDQEHDEADPDSPVELAYHLDPFRPRRTPTVTFDWGASWMLTVASQPRSAPGSPGPLESRFTRARMRRIRGDRPVPPEARPLREPARARRRRATPLASRQARRSPP